MNLNVIIQNALKYTDKKTGEVKVRIGYMLTEKNSFQLGDKFKGYRELSCFTNKSELFDLITKDMIMVPVIMTFEEKRNPLNPLRSYLELIDIKKA